MIWPMHGNLITFVTNFLISNKLKSNLKINVFFFQKNGCITMAGLHIKSQREWIFTYVIVFYSEGHSGDRKV